MKNIYFAKRNFKEIIRDPISLAFCMGLPLFLLIIFQQFNIPSDIYNIKNFAPSIVIFSFGFLSLFSGLLISKDRESSFLTRLFASPLTETNFILGYILALLPIALIQCILFFTVAFFLGLNITSSIIVTILLLLFISIMFISFGILIGCSFNDKQTPGISSIIIQLIAFTSGMWFDINTISGGFKFICNVLPFRYTVDLTRNMLNNDFSNIGMPLLIVSVYTFIILIVAIFIFKKQMTSDNK